MFKTFGTIAAAVLLSLAVPDPGIAQGFRDPMRPYSPAPPQAKINAAKEEAQRWSLGSVLIAPQRRVAVINGRTVAEGGEVDGARVLEIGPLSVRLLVRGREIILPLSAGSIKKPAADGVQLRIPSEEGTCVQ